MLVTLRLFASPAIVPSSSPRCSWNCGDCAEMWMPPAKTLLITKCPLRSALSGGANEPRV
jgi:hypothetical protein